jgi:hypothetical protein
MALGFHVSMSRHRLNLSPSDVEGLRCHASCALCSRATIKQGFHAFPGTATSSEAIALELYTLWFFLLYHWNGITAVLPFAPVIVFPKQEAGPTACSSSDLPPGSHVAGCSSVRNRHSRVLSFRPQRANDWMSSTRGQYSRPIDWVLHQV